MTATPARGRKAFGQGAVLAGTAFIPGGAEAEAVGALGDAGRVAEVAGDLGKAGEVAGDAGKAAEVTGDLGKTTEAASDAANAIESVIPRGFANADEFSRFGSTLHSGLADAGYADAQGVLQGSAVTGEKFTTGAPFDVGRVSDFDVALSGKSLFQAAKDAGVGLRSAGSRTGPLSARDLQALGPRDLSIQMAKQTGRPMNFMIYKTTESAVERAPSIIIPR